MPTHLLQLQRSSTRRVALVDGDTLHLLSTYPSIHALATAAISTNTNLSALVTGSISNESLDYDPIYNNQSDWKILPPLDHPDEPARLLVSGTGLTHLGSAANRQSMHSADESQLTDSMRMFRWGVEGGRPAPGAIGIAPEWFYKGPGTILRAHNEPLVVPPYAEDGGEEAEIAGAYLISPAGLPIRIGMAIGNEFSDHRFEKRNYLNLAGSKVRTCSLGPELIINPDFTSVAGEARIERAGSLLWSKSIRTGESEMCHSLANIEHHHFKFESHRRPGDLHVHYFGAHSLSFGDGIQLTSGDTMIIRFDTFGRPLRNPLRIDPPNETPLVVLPLK